ncbi:MAG: 4-(cytidine 5'-diphospho)-2-C-methyl-D-erythritol kinase [Gaiellaceae bacterium]
MTRARAPAKINLALAVGPRLPTGKHEVTTVLQRLQLADEVELRPAPRLSVSGFDQDTLVRQALETLAEAAGTEIRWRTHLTKRIPVAAGLGGGSSDAAAALRLANDTLERSLPHGELTRLASSLGADVPFFLHPGPQLGEGDGSTLTPLELPQDYAVLIVLAEGAEKLSTGAVYEAFAARDGSLGYAARRDGLLRALAAVREPADLAGLPRNDLVSTALAAELTDLGAFRADVSGAGPAVYALFEDRAEAVSAARCFERRGRTWVTAPAWYV